MKSRAGRADTDGFAESEARYYNAMFSQALTAQNSRHVEARHMERIKTMQDWMSGRNTRPEESIYQIGDMTSGIDPEKFRRAANDLLKFLIDWECQNGHPYKVLNLAIHMDEASPHIHLRKVWQYQDKDGVWCIGQNKALEAAGVELPEPDKKIGNKNNRKVTFDRMVREKWIEICESYGYHIEREPLQDQEHLPKPQLIALRKREKELERQRRQLEYEKAELERQKQSVAKKEAEAERRLRAAREKEAKAESDIRAMKAQAQADAAVIRKAATGEYAFLLEWFGNPSMAYKSGPSAGKTPIEVARAVYRNRIRKELASSEVRDRTGPKGPGE